MTLDREFHVKTIVPASPKSFRSIIEEQRQRICTEMDATAQEAVEGNQERKGWNRFLGIGDFT